MDCDHTEFEMYGLKCIIAYDHDAESPEGWGNDDYFLGEITHSRYSKMGREGWDKRDAWRYLPFGEGPWEFGSRLQEDGLDDWDIAYDYHLLEAWDEERETGFEVFPVELVDYGSNGAALRYCDHDDANGYIFIKVPWASDLERIAHPDFDPKAMADGVMEEWNQYLEGDVHWARIEDSDGETVASCGGFYGIEAAKEWCEGAVEACKPEVLERLRRIEGGLRRPRAREARASGRLLPLRGAYVQAWVWVYNEDAGLPSPAEED